MKTTTVLTLLICICSSLLSNNTIAYKKKIDFTFSNVQFEDNFIQLNDILILQLDYNRLVNDFISVGGYFGAGIYDEWIVESGDNWANYKYTRNRYSAHYGINSNLHVLPLIFKTNIPRFDFYISGDCGFISMFTSSDKNITPEKGHYFDYTLAGGGSIFLSKKFGLLIETGYKEFKYHKGFFAKYGLTFRF